MAGDGEGGGGGGSVGAVLHVRLDAETRSELNAYMREGGLTQSQAVRTALALGLSRAKSWDRDFLRAAFKEGLIDAQAKLRKRIQSAISTALSEFEG